ncbi:MAG: protease family protein [Microbacteriaceae bacterium]|jgi:membrane protease YdiL (CAAX protease family)|nr:protease family protein [Microbacteriaceae bacterium]
MDRRDAMTTSAAAVSSAERGTPVPGAGPARPVLFVVLAYVLSWAWVIPFAAIGATVVSGRGWPTQFPALLGPLLAAALCARSAGRRGLRELAIRMVRWRIGWRWWLAAVSPVLALLAILAAQAVSGVALPTWSALAGFSGVPVGWGVLGVAATLVLVGGLGEETGWRGYLQPALQRRMGPVAATGIVAAVWAGWHLPQFFVIQTYRDAPLAMLPVFLVGMAGGAVVLTWLYNHTRSILACAVWHGLYNLAGASAAASAGSGVIAAAVWTFVVLGAVVLLGLEWRAVRGGRDSLLMPR